MEQPIEKSECNSAPLTIDFEFTDQDFKFISGIALTHFGLSLPSSKHLMVYSRISRRMRVLGLSDFADYKAVLSGKHADRERLELLSVLTTNVTHFFREMHHFDFLRTTILPGLIEKARAGGRVRIWSAGCSTGQEPYSIALTILDICPEAADLDIKILATDIDPKVVGQAVTGKYSARELEKVPVALRMKYLKETRPESSEFMVTSSLSDLISFGVLNLIRPLPITGPIDVIFCRNVAIYFDKNTQDSVWNSMVNVLSSDGYLFIGHSERLTGSATAELHSVDVTSYQRKSLRPTTQPQEEMK